MYFERVLFATAFVSVSTLVALAEEDPFVAYLDDVEAVYIADGDTPQLSIRMYGIDAPESDQLCESRTGACYPCGERAQAVLEGMIEDQRTRYEFTGESTYGRPVATIFIGQRDINLQMIRQGHAVVLEGFLEGEMLERYLTAEAEARNAERGIWQGSFIEPYRWRNLNERLECESQ